MKTLSIGSRNSTELILATSVINQSCQSWDELGKDVVAVLGGHESHWQSHILHSMIPLFAMLCVHE